MVVSRSRILQMPHSINTASTISTLPCLLNICYAMDAYLQLDKVQFIHHDHNDQQESEESPSQKQQNVAVVYCTTGYQKQEYSLQPT